MAFSKHYLLKKIVASFYVSFMVYSLSTEIQKLGVYQRCPVLCISVQLVQVTLWTIENGLSTTSYSFVNHITLIVRLLGKFI